MGGKVPLRAHDGEANVRTDLNGDHILRNRFAKPDSGIELLGHEVDKAIVDTQLDLDIRIFGQKLFQLGSENRPARIVRCGEANGAPRAATEIRQSGHLRVDFLQARRNDVKEPLAYFSRRDGTRISREQSSAEPLLQRTNCVTDCGLGHTQLHGSSSKTFRASNGDECRQPAKGIAQCTVFHDRSSTVSSLTAPYHRHIQHAANSFPLALPEAAPRPASPQRAATVVRRAISLLRVAAERNMRRGLGRGVHACNLSRCCLCIVNPRTWVRTRRVEARSCILVRFLKDLFTSRAVRHRLSRRKQRCEHTECNSKNTKTDFQGMDSRIIAMIWPRPSGAYLRHEQWGTLPGGWNCLKPICDGLYAPGSMSLYPCTSEAARFLSVD